MKKFFVFVLTVILVSGALYAQDDELPPPASHPKFHPAFIPELKPGNLSSFGKRRKADLSKFIIEPGIDFGVGKGGINVGVSPYVGYKIWKELYAGGGVTYLYTGFKNIGFTDVVGNTYYANASWHTFGGGVFLQYNVWKGFFVRSRFEVLHRVIDDINNATIQVDPQNNSYRVLIPKVHKTIPALLLGAGYNLLENKNFFFPLMVSYNLLYQSTSKAYSVYSNGWVIQMGFVSIF